MLQIVSKLIRYPNRFLLKLKFFKKKNLKKKFSIIYNNNYWDNEESISGPGSTLKNTKNLRRSLNIIIKKYKIKTVFDAPCGDCNWIQSIIKKNNIIYTGADIVKNCISNNKNKFKNKKFNFKQLDVTEDKLPTADLFICRDFMFHLSYKDNYKFLKNIRNLKSKYILISNHTKSKDGKFNNKDIKSGDFRRINLFQPPFNFQTNFEKAIKDSCDGVDKYLLLFKNKELKKFFKYMKI